MYILTVAKTTLQVNVFGFTVVKTTLHVNYNHGKCWINMQLPAYVDWAISGKVVYAFRPMAQVI